MYDPRTLKDKTTPKVGKFDQSPTVLPLIHNQSASHLVQARPKVHKKAPAEAEARPVVSGDSLYGNGEHFLAVTLLLFFRARRLHWQLMAHLLHDVFKDAAELRRNCVPCELFIRHPLVAGIAHLLTTLRILVQTIENFREVIC